MCYGLYGICAKTLCTPNCYVMLLFVTFLFLLGHCWSFPWENTWLCSGGMVEGIGALLKSIIPIKGGVFNFFSMKNVINRSLVAYCSETILDWGRFGGWMEVLGVDDGGPSLIPPSNHPSLTWTSKLEGCPWYLLLKSTNFEWYVSSFNNPKNWQKISQHSNCDNAV